jgi:hypothetical protein
MKVIETHEYCFPNHLLPALVNNDPVIDEEDREGFDAFLDKLERYKKEYNATDYTIEYGKDSYFSHNNCLNSLSCSVTDIKVLFLR